MQAIEPEAERLRFQAGGFVSFGAALLSVCRAELHQHSDCLLW